ncbi:MAG: CDP-archaeol synthase [Clostridia bacterium]|nr:CDP-archaeol synthase [Clostridia bacterium]
MTDTFAYFCGRLFGRHKLIPSVSPKKTIEGSIGGIIFCIIGCVVYRLVLGQMNVESLPAIWIFAVLGLLVSIVSQIGDLIFSLIKRRYGIKDYGILFPGHGGVLDRFDSVIATAPLILIACEALAYFNIM